MKEPLYTESAIVSQAKLYDKIVKENMRKVFESNTLVEVIRKIVKEVTSTAEGQLNADRYIEQLRALVQLRKLNKEFKIAMGTITKFNYQEDAFYLDGVEKGMEKGMEKGIEKKSKEVVENLITQLGFSDEQAAQLARTSVAFVQQVRHSIGIDGTKLQSDI